MGSLYVSHPGSLAWLCLQLDGEVLEVIQGGVGHSHKPPFRFVPELYPESYYLLFLLLEGLFSLYIMDVCLESQPGSGFV